MDKICSRHNSADVVASSPAPTNAISQAEVASANEQTLRRNENASQLPRIPSYLSANHFAWIDDTLGCMSQPLFRSSFRRDLKAVGITTVVNLQGELPDEWWRTHYKNNRGRFTIHRIRILDRQRASAAQLRKFVAICNDARQRSTRVVVHCFRGHGRTTQLVAAYLVARLGLSAHDAIARAQTIRTAADRRVKLSSGDVRMHVEQAEAVREFARDLASSGEASTAAALPTPLLVAGVEYAHAP